MKIYGKMTKDLFELLKKIKEVGIEDDYINKCFEIALKFPETCEFQLFKIKRRLGKVLLKNERKKINLPQGDIFIGFDDFGNPVFARLDYEIPQMLIVGSSGSGKTNLLKNIINQVNDKSFIVFEVAKKELRVFIHKGFKVLPFQKDKWNPFYPPNMKLEEWLEIFTDIFTDCFNLRIETSLALKKLIKEYSNSIAEPSFKGFYEFLIERAEKDNKVYTIINIMKPVLNVFGNTFNCKIGYLQGEEILRNNVIYELEGLSPVFQEFFIKLKLQFIYHLLLDKKYNDIKVIAVIEEAKVILGKERKSTDFLSMILSRARALGLGFIFLTQSPSEIGRFVTENISQIIALRLGYSELSFLSSVLQMNKNELSGLNIPHAYYYRSGHPAIKVKIQEFKDPPYPSDKEIFEAISKLGYKPLKTLKKKERAEDKELKTASGDFERLIKDFLNFIYEHPQNYVREIYSVLNLNPEKGNRIKKILLEQGLIKEETVITGSAGKPRKRIKLTDKGYQFLGKTDSKHEEYKNLIKRILEKSGYIVFSEADRIDITAVKGEERIFIEIQLNTKNVKENAEKLLSKNGRRVILTDTHELCKNIRNIIHQNFEKDADKFEIYLIEEFLSLFDKNKKNIHKKKEKPQIKENKSQTNSKQKEGNETKDGLWTVKKVAEYLSLSVYAVYELVYKNEIPYLKIGGSIRFEPEVIKKWVKEKYTEYQEKKKFISKLKHGKGL